MMFERCYKRCVIMIHLFILFSFVFPYFPWVSGWQTQYRTVAASQQHQIVNCYSNFIRYEKNIEM